ncbi:GTPase IMAP family member 1 [Colossoma macropomum]|uniref:GTPase IMAP family member 1 n=1 Tax=Colossoma macropomum TaxID=42526 RepID=UPI001864B51A|nr:GTPase IMAP family member 1 [Colossoma macropomum]
MEENTTQSHETEREMEESKRRDAEQDCELRLVLLGWAGSGKSSVGNAVLGFRAFEPRCSADSTKPLTVKCEKKCASAAGRKVAVVDTPDWFYSERPPEEVHHQLYLCESLSAPGPHAFLFCIPMHRPNEQDLQALDALEKVFGPESVSKHTVIVFTHTQHLSKDLTLEEHLSTKRKDLLELVEKCGDRYHVLKLRAEGEADEEERKERKSVEELLEKVEKMVKESGKEFYTFPPLVQKDSGVKSREETEGNEEGDESVRRRRGGEEEERCEEMAEGSADGLEVVEDEDSTLSPPSPPPSFLRWLWDSVVGWVLWLPNMVRGSTLLGSFVGLFVGGIFGGVLGATVGSVATEVGRRKPQNQKTKSK